MGALAPIFVTRPVTSDKRPVTGGVNFFTPPFFFYAPLKGRSGVPWLALGRLYAFAHSREWILGPKEKKTDGASAKRVIQKSYNLDFRDEFFMTGFLFSAYVDL